MGTRNRYNITEQDALLPGEIFEEILRRLPVKSLLKFRCVCKSWLSLIDSERFVKIHLETSTRDPTLAHHRVIVESFPDKPTLSFCSLRPLVSELVTHSFQLDGPVPDSASSVRIVGSCDGLICILVDRKHFYLWNPSLRISKKLPFMDNNLKHGDVTKYGFGYEESTQDYKIYGILSVFWVTGRFESAGRIYSLKSNSWSIVKNGEFNGSLFGCELGTFVNGKLHWSNKGGINWEWHIISCDLKTEEHERLQLPSNLEGSDYYLALGELSGCLCMLCRHQDLRLDVWVMEQYGVKESWNKIVTVPNAYPPVEGPFSFDLAMGQSRETLFSFNFDMGQNREILICFGPNFAICSLEDAKLRYPPLMDGVGCFRQPMVYVESLVSFVQDGEQGRQE